MVSAELIQKCVLKISSAEKELFFSTAPLVQSICRRYASNSAEAQDFLQECFIQIFSKINSYDSTKGAFKPWMCKVSVNTILMILRKKKRSAQLVYVDFLPEKIEDESLLDSASLDQIVSVIQKLPIGFRTVFNLAVIENWTHEDIGKQLNIKASTSRSQLARAKAMIKQKLSQQLKENYVQRLA